MKAETLKAETVLDDDQITIAQEITKVIMKNALGELCRATSFLSTDDNVVALTTCLSLILQRTVGMLAATNEDATRTILQLMAQGMGEGGISHDLGERMIAAQKILAESEMAMFAKATSGGQA